LSPVERVGRKVRRAVPPPPGVGAATVLILDGDRIAARDAERILATAGFRTRIYRDPEVFLNSDPPNDRSCLLLEHHLKQGMSGADVHRELLRRGCTIPVVFFTANWSVQSVIDAIRAGADGFVPKPIDAAELLDSIHGAIERASTLQPQQHPAIRVRALAATLTGRERQIVRLVVSGMLNKEIAAHLGLALVTIKAHRGRAMHKLGAGNAAELAHIASIAGLVS
jgi:FixJ family two-component response regulator